MPRVPLELRVWAHVAFLFRRGGRSAGKREVTEVNLQTAKVPPNLSRKFYGEMNNREGL